MSLDHEAVEALYRDHARQMLVFFARRTLDPETATDLMAETFAVAYRDRRQFRGTSREEAVGWLFGIARHQLSGFYRRGSVELQAMRRVSVERRGLTDAEYERIEDLAGLATMRWTVRQRLQELEEGDREILRLRIVEERDYEEIAKTLGIKEDAVRARLSRALKRLRALIDEQGDEGRVGTEMQGAMQ
jgi:RNA polymerase sigma-70 factor (ECF subfamily)